MGKITFWLGGKVAALVKYHEEQKKAKEAAAAWERTIKAHAALPARAISLQPQPEQCFACGGVLARAGQYCDMCGAYRGRYQEQHNREQSTDALTTTSIHRAIQVERKRVLGKTHLTNGLDIKNLQ